MAALRAVLGASLAALGAGAAMGTDKGFELLAQDVVEEFDDDSAPLEFSGKIPDYVRGTYVITGPARWTWTNQKTNTTRRITHLLDGYSKLHRWEFRSDGSVTFKAKFLDSEFLRRSKAADDIAFNVMAQATDPPFKLTMSEFNAAQNDNLNVNVFELGGRLEVLSDVTSMMEVNLTTLDTIREYNNMHCTTSLPCSKQTQTGATGMLQMVAGGSAHPWRLPNGDYLSMRENAKYSEYIPGKESMSVYRISPDDRATNVDIVSIPVPKASYAHSFGYTNGPDGEHVIVVTQPIHYDVMNIVKDGTLSAGFTDDLTENTAFYIAPLKAGAKAIKVEGPRFFYGHFVNSYSPAPGKFVADINTEDETFFNRFSLDVVLNKTRRESWPLEAQPGGGKPPGYMTVVRYTIDTTVEPPTLTSAPLFGAQPIDNIGHEMDLFRLHPEDYGQPYCGYWAWQANYNASSKESSFASWAIVRVEICGAKPRVAAAWYRPNVYPAEPAFFPKPGSTDKTEGALFFKAVDGNTGKTISVVLDSKTMETIAEATLPINIPFTVHGNVVPPNTVEVASRASSSQAGPPPELFV